MDWEVGEDDHLMQTYMHDEEDNYLEDDEFGEYYDEYEDGYYEDDYTRISISELTDRCIWPTLSQAFMTFYPLLALCCLVRVTVYFAPKLITNMSYCRKLCHIVNSISGLVALHFFFEENLLFLVMLAILSYILLSLIYCKCQGWSGGAVAIITLVYFLACELLVVKETEWHRIRGAQMVLAMKTISLAFDLDNGTVSEFPNKLEYAGYSLQVGTVIFGPWISFHDYCQALNSKERKIDVYWFACCMRSMAISLLCFIVSTCLIHWLLLDTTILWLLAFRDATSFRFSHYFVSYLSEATAILSGLGASRSNNGGDVRWELPVAAGRHVEMPRSLVEVVVHWNMPWHSWLKNYVFKPVQPYSKFGAVLATYTASSVLHGVNFQLSAVLLSLGFYTYIEFVLRDRLSKVFDACIGAKRCKPDCGHTNHRAQPNVIATNLAFSALSVFHLAYLGLVFDSSSSEEKGYGMAHTLDKWSSLGYASHWVALATFVFYMLI